MVKQQELLYNAEFHVQQLERKVTRPFPLLITSERDVLLSWTLRSATVSCTPHTQSVWQS